MKKHFWTRSLVLLLAVSILLPLGVFPRAAETNSIYDLPLDAKGACVVNLESHAVVYEKNALEKMYPASTTKVLTALVVLENCPHPEDVTITVPDSLMFRSIVEANGMNMQLCQGESFTAEALLSALLIGSYCDVAELLAWYFGGESVSRFVEMMNETAAELGMDHSHFANAHGLHDPNHWTCPRDLALLMEKASNSSYLMKIMGTLSYKFPATPLRKARTITHTVKALSPDDEYHNDAFVAAKSGSTNEAGRCLLMYSQKDGVSFVSVIMGATMDGTQMSTETNKASVGTYTLLSYLYDNYSLRTLLPKGEQMGTVLVADTDISLPVVTGEDLVVFAPDGAEADYRTELPETVQAENAAKGAEVGRTTVLVNGANMEGAGCSLVLASSGPLRLWMMRLGLAIRHFFSRNKESGIILSLLLILALAGIAAVIIVQRVEKKKKKENAKKKKKRKKR